MFEKSVEQEKEPKIVYVYKVLERLKNGEERISFSWRANVSFYHILEDKSKGEKRVDTDFDLTNTSDDLEKLKYNFNYHKKLKNPSEHRISISNYNLSFDIPEETVKKIKEDLNKMKKEDVENIEILTLTKEEISEFTEEKDILNS